MSDTRDPLPPLPPQVAHVHSDGDFCQDRSYLTSTGWPVDLFTGDQVRAYAADVRAPLLAEIDRLRAANEGQTRMNVTLVMENAELVREREQLRADLATSMETAAKGIAALSEVVNERAASPVVPQGWRLVPVEPTPAMRYALQSDMPAEVRWAKALAAAPHPAQTEGR